MSQRLWGLLTAAAVVAVCSAAPLRAQTCNDGNDCTNSDMCSSGTCTGTPAAGSCDDGNPCTVNDTCVDGTCRGTPMEGGSCGQPGCEGTCAVVNELPVCLPDPEKQMQPCTDILGDCTTNDVCLGTLCLGTFKVCPDSDDNKCTLDVCTVQTGECQNLGPVNCGPCGTCNQETGGCDAANEGASCDDFNECTGDGNCTAGDCLSGGSITPGETTPTETPTGIPTGTATATATPTDTPIGIPTGTATFTTTPTGMPTGTATATVTPTGMPTGTTSATVTPTNTVSGVTATATATRTPSVTPTALPINASIIVGSAAGLPGSTVTFQVKLETTVEVAGTQNDLAFDAKARIKATEDGKPSCTVNPAIDKDATSFAFQPADCTPGTDCTGIRALVLALDNVVAIPTNSTLYTCEVEIAADATGTYPLTCTDPGAGDPDGKKVGADCTDGTITVAVSADATIVIGSATGAAGDFVPLDVSLQTGVDVAGTQNDITFPTQAGVAADDEGKPLCEVNPDIDKTLTIAFQPTGCVPGTDCTSIRAVVFSINNVFSIPNGAKLYSCQIAIAEDAADGTYPLTCSNAGASDPDGGALVTGCVDGSVVVGVQPPPTGTPTVTPSTSPSPTPTTTSGTPPPATATNTPATPPTRTPTPADNDDCQIVAPAHTRPAWMLFLPAALLFALRRRRR